MKRIILPLVAACLALASCSGKFHMSDDKTIANGVWNNFEPRIFEFDWQRTDLCVDLSLSVTFDAQPTRRAYFLTGEVTGLTAADIVGVTYTVTDEAGNDYTDNLTLTVQDGKLVFTNAKPQGMFLIVR